MPKVAPAPAPRVDPDAEVEVSTKPEAKPDQGLLKLYGELEKSKLITGQKFAQIVDYVENHELTSAQIKATLKARGLSDGSAAMETSRILALIKPDNAETREKWRNGEISLRAVRQAIQGGTKRKTPLTPKQKVSELLAKAAATAYPEFEGIREFLEMAKAAWNNEVATQTAPNDEIEEIEAVEESEEEEEEEVEEEVE